MAFRLWPSAGQPEFISSKTNDNSMLRCGMLFKQLGTNEIINALVGINFA